MEEKPILSQKKEESDNILEVSTISKIYKVSERKFFSYKNSSCQRSIFFN